METNLRILHYFSNSHLKKMTEKYPNKQWLTVGYEIKNQIRLFIGERSKTQFDSGCKMFDLIFKDTFRVN